MTKLLYFTNQNVDINNLSGVGKKIVSQCRAFALHLGEENVLLASFCNGGYWLRTVSSSEKKPICVEACNVSNSKQAMTHIYPEILRITRRERINCVYYRATGLGLLSHRFLHDLHKDGSVIFVEVPTYPFWKEFRICAQEDFRKSPAKGIKRFLSNADYKLETLRLQNCVDRIVTFSTIERLWGLPVLGISNGYDFESVPLVKKHYPGDPIRLIVAATLRENHAIDRCLMGLHSYYLKQGKQAHRVELHIVGEGDASAQLRKLATNLGLLGDSVFFHGYLYGDDLTRLYSNMDAGISALGFHRYGVQVGSPLKSKEYFALGLPCIGTTLEHDIINSDVNMYYHIVPSDDSELNVVSLIRFIEDLRIAGIEPKQIKRDSSKLFDWKVILSPIVQEYRLLLDGQDNQILRSIRTESM